MTARNGKPCKKCGTSVWYADGRCKHCKNMTRDRKKENASKRARRDPEKENAIRRARQKENLGKHAARARAYYATHQEKERARSRKWLAINPEKANAKVNRRRTRKTAAGGSYTAAEWISLLNHYDNKCLCCGRNDITLTVDHIVPVTRGGSSNIDNLQPLCLSCNSRKGDKTIDYRPEKGMGRWIQRKLFG